MNLQGLGVLVVVILSLTLAAPRANVSQKVTQLPPRSVPAQVTHDPEDKHYEHPDFVKKVKEKLFPAFTNEIIGGPEDPVYFALSQAQIDDLIRFYNDRREPYPYVYHGWDCDDTAREFLHHSRVWNLRRNGPNQCVPAVGSLYVKINGAYDLIQGSPAVNAYHVLNVILREDGQWLLFEPQSSKLLPIDGPVVYEQVVTVLKLQI